MPNFELTIDGKTYDVEAPDESHLPTIANQIAKESQGEQTSTAGEYAGALTRGLGPTAAAAAIGGAIAGPPGALAGAGIYEGAKLAGDILVAATNYAAKTRFDTPSEAIQHLLTSMGVPEAKSSGAKMTQEAASMVGSTLGFMGAGKMMKGASSKAIQTIGDVLASSPRQQLVGAAVGGATGEAARQTAEDMGASPGWQAAASLVGNLAGGYAGGIVGAERKAVGAAANPVVQAFEELNLKTPTTSEVKEPTTLFGKLFRTMGTNIPVIGGAAREERRAVEISAGLENLLQKYNVTHGSTAPFAEDVAKDIVAQRGKELTRLTTDKNNIISALEATGETVPMPKALGAIQTEIDALQRANPEAFGPIIQKFEQLKSGIENNTFKNIDTNLDVASTMLKDPNITAIAKQGQPGALRVYQAIKDDMQGFIEAKLGAPAKATFEKANAELHDMVQELGNRSLKKALQSGTANPDDIGRMLVDIKNPASFDMVTKGLSEEGKQFAKQSMLQTIANNSTNSATGSLSPERFRNQLNNLDENIKKLFTPKEKKMLDAWATVIDASKFSRFFAPDAPTGVRTIVGTTLTAIGSAVIPKIIIGALAHHAYESKYMRDLLLKINANPTSSKFLIPQAVHAAEIIGAKELGTQMIKKNVPITFAEHNSKTEQLGQGTVSTDLAHGYRAVSMNGTRQRLYGPDNALIGVFDDLDQVRRYTDRQVVKRIKLPKSYAP